MGKSVCDSKKFSINKQMRAFFKPSLREKKHYVLRIFVSITDNSFFYGNKQQNEELFESDVATTNLYFMSSFFRDFLSVVQVWVSNQKKKVCQVASGSGMESTSSQEIGSSFLMHFTRKKTVVLSPKTERILF